MSQKAASASTSTSPSPPPPPTVTVTVTPEKEATRTSAKVVAVNVNISQDPATNDAAAAPSSAPKVPVVVRPHPLPAKEDNSKESSNDEEEGSKGSTPSPSVMSTSPKVTPWKKIVQRTASCNVESRDDGSELLAVTDMSSIIFHPHDSPAKNPKHLSSPLSAKPGREASSSSSALAPVPFVIDKDATESAKKSSMSISDDGDGGGNDSSDRNGSSSSNAVKKNSNSGNSSSNNNNNDSSQSVVRRVVPSKSACAQPQTYRQSMILDEDMEKLRQSSIMSDGPPKEEDLEALVEAIVNGRKEVSHSVDPSEVTEMNTRLGAGASGSVFK